jgi:hypothetical protein
MVRLWRAVAAPRTSIKVRMLRILYGQISTTVGHRSFPPLSAFFTGTRAGKVTSNQMRLRSSAHECRSEQPFGTLQCYQMPSSNHILPGSPVRRASSIPKAPIFRLGTARRYPAIAKSGTPHICPAADTATSSARQDAFE